MMERKLKVELQGTEALTITESRALIRAALAGRFALSPSDAQKVEDACQKVGSCLIGAGQDRELVSKLFDIP